MAKPNQQPEFNFEEHERMLAIRYTQLARYEAFDKLVDMALDGVITLNDAKVAWESEELTYGDPDKEKELPSQ